MDLFSLHLSQTSSCFCQLPPRGSGVNLVLVLSSLREKARGRCGEVSPLHGREMDELAPKHSRGKLPVTEGLSGSNDRKTGRLVKWPAIHYQLAARHKINRAPGILNEPASPVKWSGFNPSPRCTALGGAPANAGFRVGPWNPDSKTKETAREEMPRP